ncbi:MAG: BON domain-containing protein [Anaerolineae bacterium]
MTDNRQSSNYLQVVVLHTILMAKPQYKGRLFVIADSDGTVYLRGSVPYHRERKVITELARSVSGVTFVFCNCAAEA